MIWQRKKIGDLINLKRGYDLPSSNRIEGDVPIISSAGITDFHNEFKKNGEGVVTGRYGTLGEVFYINGKYWPLNTTLYITDFKGNQPKFIYYFLKTLQLERFNGAAAVPGLDRNVIHRVDVLFPKDINIQRKIASILSAYDELIENNKQRIKLLEEMAEEIYKEWFVRLRFPGYEATKFEDGLPEGWKESRLDAICDFQLGQSPSSDFYNENGKGLPFHQGVTNFNSRFPSHVSYCTDLKRIADEGDILLSVRAPVGRINIATEKLIIGRGLSSVKHKNGLPNYCFYLMKEIFKKEDSFGNGSVFNAVTKNDLLGIKTIEPSFEICKKFQDLIRPFDDEIKVLTDKNLLLQQTRDLLLPRLISGKLSVEHLVEKEDRLSVAAEPEVNYQAIK
jgi:type I restriction enzyme S subunit